MEKYPTENCYYLFDYEIPNSPVTGLDLIRIYNLQDQAVLVTSYFNDSYLQIAVERIGVKLFPKFALLHLEELTVSLSSKKVPTHR